MTALLVRCQRATTAGILVASPLPACARKYILPAVRANVLLLTLSFDIPEIEAAEALVSG